MQYFDHLPRTKTRLMDITYDAHIHLLNPQDLVGKTEICSECGKQKTIQLALDQGPDRHGAMHSPYLTCEDCVSPDVEGEK